MNIWNITTLTNGARERGLSFDIIASRDILPGEEVGNLLLYFVALLKKTNSLVFIGIILCNLFARYYTQIYIFHPFLNIILL